MLSQMSTDQTSKIDDQLAGLFFEQQIELNGGGFLDMRFNMDVNLETVRLQKQFVDSRRLNPAQLVARFDGDKSRNIRGDKEIIMATMGYDLDQATLTCDNQYKELIEMTWIDALAVALLDFNFTQVYANDQIAIGFKPEVLTPANGGEPLRVVVPDSYWDDQAANLERLRNGYIPLPKKTSGSPVERKLAMITALLDQPAQKEASAYFKVRYMRVISHLGSIKAGNVKRESMFRPEPMDKPLPKPTRANRKSRGK